MRTTFTAAAFLCAAFAAQVFGSTIKNVELGFTLVLPDRLQPVTGPGGDTVAAFATSDPALGVPDLTASVFRMRGTIGREHLDPSKVSGMPQGVKVVGVRQQKWKSFDIDVLEMDVAQGDIHMCVRGAQVPLRNEAIQVNVGAVAGKEAEVDAMLGQLLAGLDGPTNWLTAEERGARLGEGFAKMAIWIALLAVGITAGFRALRKRYSRRDG